jgi:anti-sigma factor RsiW
MSERRIAPEGPDTHVEIPVDLDKELSALVDGQVAPEREAEMRARISADPVLGGRLADFERVDSALRALPAVELPRAQKEEMRARIASEVVSRAQARNQSASRPTRLTPRRGRLWASAALAAAASLAIYLVLPDAPSGLDETLLATALEDATDEEIGIALDYETLADLDVIEDLELLELMMDLEEQEAGRG